MGAQPYGKACSLLSPGSFAPDGEGVMRGLQDLSQVSLVINGFVGAAEAMLIKCDGSVVLVGMQARGRTEAEFQGVFRCWGTKWESIPYGQAPNRKE